MAAVCLDACVVLELLLPGPATARVEAQWRQWLEEGADVVAPVFFQVETTSVIRNKIFRREISEAAGVRAFQEIRRLAIRFVDFPDLQEQAMSLAVRFNRPEAYDTQYVAVAQHLGCELWTIDRRLANSVSPALPWVKLVAP